MIETRKFIKFSHYLEVRFAVLRVTSGLLGVRSQQHSFHAGLEPVVTTVVEI